MIQRGMFVLLVGLAVTVPAFGQYCSPVGGTGYACGIDEFIQNVTIGAINNTTACYAPPGYSDFTAQSCNVTAGAATPISVTVGGWFSAADLITVYCDWNGNGLFTDAGESFAIPQTGPNSAGGTVLYSGTITAPIGSVASTRMRVVLLWNTAANPCLAAFYGEDEDYTITVGGGGPVPCTLLFDSPTGNGTLRMQNTPCPAAAGTSYLIGITLAAGTYPAGWFGGLDIPFAQLISEYNAGFPFIGTLDGAGASSFGPIGAPSGLQIWAVTAQFAPGFGNFLFYRPAVTYTIP